MYSFSQCSQSALCVPTYAISCLLDFIPTCFPTSQISYLLVLYRLYFLPTTPPLPPRRRPALSLLSLSLSAALCEEVVVVVVVGVLSRFICLLSVSSAAVSYNS